MLAFNKPLYQDIAKVQHVRKLPESNVIFAVFVALFQNVSEYNNISLSKSQNNGSQFWFAPCVCLEYTEMDTHCFGLSSDILLKIQNNESPFSCV